MSDLFMLSEKQFNRIKPYFPLSHGVPRGRFTGAQRNYLRDKARPAMEGRSQRVRAHKTLYNRFMRWSKMGIQLHFGGTCWQSRDARPTDD